MSIGQLSSTRHIEPPNKPYCQPRGFLVVIFVAAHIYAAYKKMYPQKNRADLSKLCGLDIELASRVRVTIYFWNKNEL